MTDINSYATFVHSISYENETASKSHSEGNVYVINRKLFHSIFNTIPIFIHRCRLHRLWRNLVHRVDEIISRKVRIWQAVTASAVMKNCCRMVRDVSLLPELTIGTETSKLAPCIPSTCHPSLHRTVQSSSIFTTPYVIHGKSRDFMIRCTL
jgi:hypothetical protein